MHMVVLHVTHHVYMYNVYICIYVCVLCIMYVGGWDRTRAASREYGAMMHFSLINSSLVS